MPIKDPREKFNEMLAEAEPYKEQIVEMFESGIPLNTIAKQLHIVPAVVHTLLGKPKLTREQVCGKEETK